MTTLPVYLVVDTSQSLAGDAEPLNHAISGLIDSVQRDPLLAEVVWLALIRFSFDAEELLPLTSIREVDRIPALIPSGSTAYGAVFSLVHRLIDRDYSALREAGESVYRPLMFFISDGAPVDLDWRGPLADLQAPSFRPRPRIIAFGIGDIDPSIVREVGGDFSFMIDSTETTSEAIVSIFSGLTATLQSSVVSVTSETTPTALVPRGWIDLATSDDLL